MSADSQSSGRRGEPTTSERAAAETQGARAATMEAQRPTTTPATRPSGAGVALTTEHGSTRIGEGVVAKIAGLAARDIPGVFSMGSGMARRVGQLRNLIPGSTEAASQGVSVEVGEREAAVDLNVVTWYGQSIVEICEAVRRNVIGQVEGMTGLHVVEVNIQVDDIHVEMPDTTPEPTQRVQ
jgi:uncharacterized alkaline shock family protein YloU